MLTYLKYAVLLRSEAPAPNSFCDSMFVEWRHCNFWRGREFDLFIAFYYTGACMAE
ncbi:MAG: hypothetical protein LBF72_00260 [Holosporales bacterium]|nr:hypothetical protein [Holosporales bacterium]